MSTSTKSSLSESVSNKNLRIIFLKIGLDASLQFEEIWFHIIAPVLEKDLLKISNLASFW